MSDLLAALRGLEIEDLNDLRRRYAKNINDGAGGRAFGPFWRAMVALLSEEEQRRRVAAFAEDPEDVE